MNYYLFSAIKAVVFTAILMVILLYIQWVERKLIAHVQLRLGPYRVGPHGLLQPLADTLKLLTKEDLLPPGVNKFFYVLAPVVAITLALISICVMPFGPTVNIAGIQTAIQLTDINIGVVFVLAISSLTVYGVVLAGWSSNSKYPLLGGLRSSAQMISYELPLGVAVASALLMSNTLSLQGIIESQNHYYGGWFPAWNVFRAPFPQVIGFVLFLISVFAETNRVPFDLPEAESELVAGFHTEYSAMKFAGFFMAEYANMITVSAMATTLFLGGWLPLWPAARGSHWFPVGLFALFGLIAIVHGLHPAHRRDRWSLRLFGLALWAGASLFLIPAVAQVILPMFWFGLKTGLILFTFIWVRATLPRFRYDQLMRFAWSFMFPLAALNLFLTALLVALFG